ncbi:M3 family metallopeptidase [Chitinivorax sp. B]|uniref:M3 family metallopeptidase n=1 Tax=Chitinivorax sp. B TaxID=2502235 RepID=UPI0010F9B78D|nr:M3 family metallopeptidase [Chitinivorax sp. B]
MNPLLDFTGLPKYNAIKPGHVNPAIDQLLAENQALVEQLVADPATPTWTGFIRPLDAGLEKLSRAWSQVNHLNYVVSSPELREAYNENLPKITQFYADLAQNLGLYAKYKALKSSDEWARLDSTQRKIIDDELRDFVLGGAELAEDKKVRFKILQEELANLSAKFGEHLLDATDAYSLYIDHAEDLDGLPSDSLAAAQAAAEVDGKTGYKLTLQIPSYLPVMQYCHNRTLRETLYHAFVTRASEFGPAELDNTPLIDQILALRTEEATLLGYTTYADVSLATKMAESPTQVMRFLRDLASKAKPFAQKDWDEVNAYARIELGIDKLEAWDTAYVSEKLREARYAFSDQEVKQYFPEPVVLDGLFKLLSTIYGVTIKADQAETWHKDAKFYRIEHQGQLIGQFYLDLYARTGKRGGAWMDDAISRVNKQDYIQTPVAYLVCNFSAPIGDKPALFTHDEVITLFHEAGHGLHHLMTHVSERPVSGINGVEWDAVELPSQFMENFCWEWDVLSQMTRHVDTGEILPRVLYDKMIAAKNFQSGMQFVRQLEFSLFDMQIHSGFTPGKGRTVMDILQDVRKEVAVVIPPEFNRFPQSFSHIFAGGYAAGYYSYKWAEVLSADAYAAFEENGILNPEIGRRFWHEILAVGGSRPALDSFKAFRGREPEIDALLRHNGMSEAA